MALTEAKEGIDWAVEKGAYIIKYVLIVSWVTSH